MDIIEPSRSAFSSPVVLVPKSDGSLRFCVDYRELNKVTTFDAEPVSDPHLLMTQLSGDQYFTKIDLTKGFWQIPVVSADRHKTAFQTPFGLFQFKRMPFGLVSAPATFARMMRQLKLEESNAVHFFDDVLVHSPSWKSHLKHVHKTLQKIVDYGLTIRPSKVFAGFRELEFLGFQVGAGFLKPTPEKVSKILSIPTPSTKKQVRSLLGLIGFYRRFVPNFSTVMAPLTDLTKGKGNSRIIWTPDCQNALDRIRQIMSAAPVLRLPCVEQDFVLQTDASDTGLGAVLLQEFEGSLHPVSFASRKLLDRETRYSTIEKECLAIVWAVSVFARYLWGQCFMLQVDHRPLAYLNTAAYSNSRIMRWALSLQQFRFQIVPLKGEDNVVADILSRSDCTQLVQ